MQVFRFVTYDGSTVRLDLNNPQSGWFLGRGFDLGVKRWEKTYITQPPYSGAVLASSWAPLVRVRFALFLAPQPSVAAMRTRLTELRTELERETNTIEFREPGDSVSFYMDTFRADVPSVHRGLEIPNEFLFKAVVGPFIIELDRLPDLRGAGAHV